MLAISTHAEVAECLSVAVSKACGPTFATWAELRSVACPASCLAVATWAYALPSTWLAEVLLDAVGALAVRHGYCPPPFLEVLCVSGRI